MGVAPKDTKELEGWLRKKTEHQVAKNLNKILEIYWSHVMGNLPFAKSLMKRFSNLVEEKVRSTILGALSQKARKYPSTGSRHEQTKRVTKIMLKSPYLSG